MVEYQNELGLTLDERLDIERWEATGCPNLFFTSPPLYSAAALSNTLRIMKTILETRGPPQLVVSKYLSLEILFQVMQFEVDSREGCE